MIKYNSLLVMFGLIIAFSISPKNTKAQNDLLKVAESLQKSEGKVTIYFPAAITEQAKSIQTLIEKAVDYYSKHLNINIPISVVLFGPEEFARYTKEKYGS